MKTNLLVSVPNWLGDGVMSMPVFPLIRKHAPGARITAVLKPSMESLWRMCPDVDALLPLEEGGPRTSLAAAGRLRREKFDEVLIFPNSFRSAFVPWLARIPSRVGMAGHNRSWMLTRVIPPVSGPGRTHQSWEYMQIAGLSGEVAEIGAPRLAIPPATAAEIAKRLGVDSGGVNVGMIPGAARGPSKQWPTELFAAVAAALAQRGKCRVLLFGTAKESGLCGQVAERAGAGAVNLAGKTSIPELAAMLSMCRAVVCNDSGGMHLAAAAGSKVIAVFGMTDPSKTGPLGKGHVLIVNENVAHSRDIKRDSEEARAALAAIAPKRVLSAVTGILES